MIYFSNYYYYSSIWKKLTVESFFGKRVESKRGEWIGSQKTFKNPFLFENILKRNFNFLWKNLIWQYKMIDFFNLLEILSCLHEQNNHEHTKEMAIYQEKDQKTIEMKGRSTSFLY